MSDSVNDMELNSILLENLYRNSLVEIKDGNPLSLPDTPFLKEVETVTKIPAIKFLGNNAKNITILVNDPGNTFMPEGHLAFLTKILGACKLNIGDVAIVNTAHATNIQHIAGTLQPSKILAFGIDVAIKGVDHVKAPAIGELVPETDESKAKKSKLWTDLKRLLGL